MTIDEAIEQFKYDAECNRVDLDFSYAEHNEQIAEWLEELKVYQQHEIICNKGYNAGYNKAIDDFTEKIIRYVDCGHLCSPTEIRWSDFAVVEMVKKIAEQLKAGESIGNL